MFWIFLGLITIFVGFLLYQMVKKTSLLYTAAIFLIVVGFGLAGLLWEWLGANAKPTLKTIDLKSRQFAYEPPIIRVNKGDIVELQLTTEDVTHGFYLDGYDIDRQIEPHKHEEETKESDTEDAHEHEHVHEEGPVTRVTFVADKTGRFTFRCSRTCGTLHPFMVGTLIVKPNYLYSGSLSLALGLTLGCLLYTRRKN